MYQPETASAAEKCAFLSAERYSAAEIAVLADQEVFHQRRIAIWGETRRGRPGRDEASHAAKEGNSTEGR